MAEEPKNLRAEEAFDVGSRQYFVQNYAAAEASFALAARLQPNDVKYHYCLGDARMMQKKLETAELAFAVAAKLGHPDAGIHLKVVCKDRERRRAEEAYQAGRTQYCSKSYVLAEASFAEAARLQPTDLWYHYALGRARYEQKKWAAAEASFDPKMLQKKLEAALSAFTEAERLGHPHAGVFLKEIQEELQRKKATEAPVAVPGKLANEMSEDAPQSFIAQLQGPAARALLREKI
ncbi:unnamed protein product [Symbiodinium sp. CCMP2592]|nr:unnamed protein product [Symbiodinium sp. CCMP2592]